MLRFRKLSTMFFITILILFQQLCSANLFAITRDVVKSTADLYENYFWDCSSSNANSTYNYFFGGDSYFGVAYNYGGFDEISDFQTKINNGVIAGNSREHCSGHLCIHRDFAGVDCSGYVSKTWGTGQHTTSDLPNISTAISWNDLRRGDILNKAGSHVRLFDSWKTYPSQMWVYEATIPPAADPATVIYRYISQDPSYTPRRYNNIQERLADMNYDGAVNISDVTKIKLIAAELYPYQACSDINGDGRINVSDVMKAKRMSAGLDPLRLCTE